MRSPIFSFFVVLLVVCGLTFIIAMMAFNTPTDTDTYMNSSSTVNQTQSYLNTTVAQLPSWILPAVLLTVAISLISAIAMIKRR